MSTFLWILYALVTLRSISSIIFHGSRPTKSLSWFLAVLLLPFAGALLYYMFGVNRRKFNFFRDKQEEKKKQFDEKYKNLHALDNTVTFKTSKQQKLSKLIESSTLLKAYNNNKVTVLNNGEQTFNSIFNAMQKAEKYIHLQYYIFSKGDLTERFYSILKDKINQGVEVRLIYDAFGSYSFKNKTIKKFKSIGVKAFPMMPIKFGNLLYTLNYRNHRKIIVIDGKVGFTGGVNVTDKYIKPISNVGIWKDIHLKLEGPIVNSLHRVFIKDFYFASNDEVLLHKKYIFNTDKKGEHTAQIVAAGPDSKQPAIMQQYIQMINIAENNICIANPYFIPSTSVLQALKIAALSGVSITILIPKVSDSLMAKYSMFSRLEELLEVGIKIYLRPDFSHSKMILIDGEILSVGSGNFDYRSFEHNFETNAVIYDQKITKSIQEKFNIICNEDTILKYETFKNRALWKKLLEGIAKFFSPLL
ncbi:cardiolipin synthase [Cellulophaga omnivescoria]|uniref:cardiolipin synthase n=1 Tax=Cellulophaga omnivescoria TaxID=1888890 RepID=UPI000985E8CF|nr:cardiolipin synthase [Cellulophaga omnivescoria]